jgi:hypothetical protein
MRSVCVFVQDLKTYDIEAYLAILKLHVHFYLVDAACFGGRCLLLVCPWFSTQPSVVS